MNEDAAGEYLFSYYGDDFTGSTDALEALAGNGVPTVLFVRPPDERGLEAFPGCGARNGYRQTCQPYSSG